MKDSKAAGSTPPAHAAVCRQGVLVLGMHRSGTSAMTRVLNLLGCALPHDLIGPGDGNALGHWEASDAVRLNYEILASAGSTWEDWGPINPDWRRSGLRLDMLGRVVGLVQQHAALGPLFAVKDPRLCRLADLWLEAMDQAGVEPLVILMLRNPLEVVRSLESRDLMVPAYGQLLWLRHVLDAEWATRGRKRVVCRYDQLMRNWPGLIARIKSGLDLALPRNSAAIRATVDAFLSPDQRHQEVDLAIALDDPGLSVWLRRTLAILVRWSETGEDRADYAELDRLREQFDMAHSALATLLLDPEITGSTGSGSRLKAQLGEQLGLAQHAAAEAQARIEQAAALEGEVAALRSEVERLEQQATQAAAAGQRVAELVAEAETRQLRVTELETQLGMLDGLRQDLQRQTEENADLAGRFGAAESALAQRQEELEARHGTLDGLRQDLQRQTLENAELTGRLGAAESALAQRQEELAQVWQQLRAADEASGVARAEAEQQRSGRLAAEQRAAAFEHDAQELRARFDAADAAQAKAERELATRSAEIVQLTAMLREQEAAAQAADEARAGLERDLEAGKADNAALRARLEQAESVTQATETARIAAEQKLAARFDEIARLTRLLVDEGERVSQAAADAEWLRQVNQLAQGFPRWWAAMPARLRRRREHARFRRAGLFDAGGYLELYPDVAADGMDPLRHYILHGMGEGRTRVG